jgi:ligand-binding sensor domain-containing protein/putative methionine-R-sulfoxide reductase with GAF domain/anti-sigma regulatory factor (Ser/Thr protein kinase)
LRKVVIILLLVFSSSATYSQSNIIFHHLNTANGLSYLGVNDICTDQKGNLWIATGNGLNMFTGKTTDKYFASEYPQLQSSNIAQVVCDSSNRIWVLTQGGYLTLLDEKRQLHRVSIYDEGKPVKIIRLLYTPRGAVYLYTPKGNYKAGSPQKIRPADSLSNSQFQFLPILDYDKFQMKGSNSPFSYDEDHYLLVYNDGLLKVNHQTNRVEQFLPLPGMQALARWGQKELLYYDQDEATVKTVDLNTQQTKYPFGGVKDQYGKELQAVIRQAAMISNRQLLLTTENEGIYIFDTAARKLINYRHSIDDPSSLSNNTQTFIATGQKGWVFLVCNPSGVSYFNTSDFIGSKQVFTDGKGKGFDGYVSGIATADNNTYYIGTSEGMLEWKRNTNTTTFIDYTDEEGKSVFRKQEVFSIVIDKNDRVWAATRLQGIIVLDKKLNLIRHIKNTGPGRFTIKIDRLSQLMVAPDGNIWACGRGGILKINPDTWEVDNMQQTALRGVDSLFCSPVLFTDKDNLWFYASPKGLYHYNIPADKLEAIQSLSDANNPGIFCLNTDRDKNIYAGSRKGLYILYKNGRLKNIKQADGLLIDRAEGLLLDGHGRMWIGNDIGLACYNPADSSLRTFDERYGLSIYGFRVGSYFQTPNGEFIFGTPRGLQYFHPDSLFNRKISLNVSVTKIETKNIASTITESEVFRLTATDNQVTFHFGTVDYSPHLRTYYEYKLEGLDKEWIQVADQSFVRYNSLGPETYTFKVRVSNDGKYWQDADNAVTIIIATPVMKTWWFRVLGVVLSILIIGLVINYYRRQQADKRSRLETELVITYFASQINSHNNTDDLLWDVARNCISKLHFEDCVIYLKDESGNNLVQKAAYGPKNAVDFTIHQPIQIPVGQGITGTVAVTGKAEIVNDTAADSRYIVDDERRHSEIAVPIFINNKVVGVIDSEHRQKNFFTQRHLTILKTIAALCANQIQKTKAEEERQKATIELLENKQKATESRLQSLRLQMNPHFLFNALNSIQQMILANEEIVATKYLSRFSKLLRAVLIHSDKETISLKEEIDILKMYVELESVRFREAFSYTITCDENLETEEIKIPTLLVQPFVENAIWHGLMHKEGNRRLQISFSEKDDFLQCIIEDNGVGRKKAREISNISGQDKKHTSRGIAVSEERLKTLKNSSGQFGSIQINDLEGPSGEGLGTQVIINFPV